MNYNQLPDNEIVSKTAQALSSRGVETTVVINKTEALEKIKLLIPHGASVMNGGSVTLEQIGFIDYLKSGSHSWNNLHKSILEEKDHTKQLQLRKQAILSDFYLGSVNALTQEGEFVIASNTGSQLPHVIFTSTNVILVVSTKKIVPTLSDAMKRLEEYVVPLEDKHMRDLYNVGTYPSKIVIFKRENPVIGRKVRIILVNENLGF